MRPLEAIRDPLPELIVYEDRNGVLYLELGSPRNDDR
jgi:hypothetical protein